MSALFQPFKLKDVGLDKDGQRALVGLTSIFDGNGVLPSASRPYEQNLKALEDQYEQACHEFLELLPEMTRRYQRQEFASFGLREEDIFSSRDVDSFVLGVERATGGRGVDVALNSLSGEALRATWERCMAPLGRFVEVGKHDELLADCGLDASGIQRSIEQRLARMDTRPALS